MAQQRPLVAIYEPDEDDVEQLVHREMNDDEYAQWQKDVAAYKKQQADEAARPHPLIEQVQAMTANEQAELKTLLA